MNRTFSNKGGLMLLLVALVLVLMGCEINTHQETPLLQDTIGNPTPEDFLSNPKADIFYFGGVVYSNAEHLDWVKERAYTKTKLLFEVAKQTSQLDEFVEGAANKLSVGAKIYDTDTEIFVAIVDGKEIRYIKVVEG